MCIYMHRCLCLTSKVLIVFHICINMMRVHALELSWKTNEVEHRETLKPYRQMAHGVK